MSGMDCGHQFCGGCWTEYLTTKIMDEGMGQTISCAAHGCDILVDDQTVMWVSGSFLCKSFSFDFLFFTCIHIESLFFICIFLTLSLLLWFYLWHRSLSTYASLSCIIYLSNVPSRSPLTVVALSCRRSIFKVIKSCLLTYMRRCNVFKKK